MSISRSIGTAGALGLGAYGAYKTADFVNKAANKVVSPADQEEQRKQYAESRAKATKVGARMNPTDPKQFASISNDGFSIRGGYSAEGDEILREHIRNEGNTLPGMYGNGAYLRNKAGRSVRVGTITKTPFGGNPGPMWGSQSQQDAYDNPGP